MESVSVVLRLCQTTMSSVLEHCIPCIERRHLMVLSCLVLINLVALRSRMKRASLSDVLVSVLVYHPLQIRHQRQQDIEKVMLRSV